MERHSMEYYLHTLEISRWCCCNICFLHVYDQLHWLLYIASADSAHQYIFVEQLGDMINDMLYVRSNYYFILCKVMNDQQRRNVGPAISQKKGKKQSMR